MPEKIKTTTGRLIPMHRLSHKYTAKETSGFTLVETLIVVVIFTFVVSAFFNLLLAAQSSFYNTNASIDIRNSLRLASEKMALELRESGSQSSTPQFSILSGQGTGGSDILRFSIPILCSSTSTLLTPSGVPANWGAPLTWGCNSYTCMNSINSCANLAYKYIQYSINASSILQRQILNTNYGLVAGSTTNVGNNIANLKASLSTDGHMITFTLTGQMVSPVRRTVTATYVNMVLLNNING